eukprot:7527261-Pyramimonas_sp.AAC.1
MQRVVTGSNVTSWKPRDECTAMENTLTAGHALTGPYVYSEVFPKWSSCKSSDVRSRCCRLFSRPQTRSSKLALGEKARLRWLRLNESCTCACEESQQSQESPKLSFHKLVFL